MSQRVKKLKIKPRLSKKTSRQPLMINADEAVKDLEDNFNDEKKYLTKDVASEAEKEVDSDEKKNSSDETGKEN